MACGSFRHARSYPHGNPCPGIPRIPHKGQTASKSWPFSLVLSCRPGPESGRCSKEAVAGPSIAVTEVREGERDPGRFRAGKAEGCFPRGAEDGAGEGGAARASSLPSSVPPKGVRLDEKERDRRAGTRKNGWLLKPAAPLARDH